MANNLQELGDEQGWTFVGYNADGSAQFQVIDADNVGKNFVVAPDFSLVGWLPDTPPPGSEGPPPMDTPILLPPVIVSAPPPVEEISVLEDDPPPPLTTVAHDNEGNVQEVTTPPPESSEVDSGGSQGDTPSMPNVGDPTHVYLGSHDGFDWYALDSGNVRTIWGVLPGDDSRAIIADTWQTQTIASPTPIVITDAEAAARGWTPAGYDAQGRQQFKVEDSTVSVWKVFSVDPGTGNADLTTLHNGGSTLPSGNAGTPGAPGTVVTTPAQGVTYTDEQAAQQGWTPAGRDAQGRQQFTVPDTTNGQYVTFSVDPTTGAYLPDTSHFSGPLPTTGGGGSTTAPGSGSNTTGGTGGGGTATVPQRLFTHPLTGQAANIPTAWTAVGITSKGNPVFQLYDGENHRVLQWYLDKNFSAQGVMTVPTLGVMVPMADNTQVPATGGGGGGGGTTTIPNTTMRSFTHPVTGQTADIPDAWRQVGTTSKGNPVFQLEDADHRILQWYLDRNFQATGTLYAQTLGVMVPMTDTSSAVTTTPSTTTTATNWKPLLLIGGLGALAWYFGTRKRNPGRRRRQRA